MNSKGMHNQKGVNAQNQAAMSLFLQFLQEANFSHIHLEPDNSEDFDLVFQDASRIICESKYKEQALNYSALKEILSSIIEKGIGENDKVLIVCKKISEDLLFKVSNVKFSEMLVEEFKNKHGFDEQMLALLPRLNFWVYNKDEIKEINCFLVAELFKAWLPEGEIEQFTNHLQQAKFSQKAEESLTYSRDEFTQDLEQKRKEIQNRSDYFNDRQEKENQFTKLEEDIKNHGLGQWGSGSFSALSIRLDLMSFAINKLKERKDLVLEEWNDLWQLNKIPFFTFGIIDIFKKNMNSLQNIQYILEYLKRHIKNIIGYSYVNYFTANITQLLTDIIDTDRSGRHFGDVFLVVEKILKCEHREIFYLKNDDSSQKDWERQGLCNLLNKIYKHQYTDSSLKENIVNLIFSNFNLIKDEGKFGVFVAGGAFPIIFQWLNEDFIARFSIFLTNITKQYDLYYKKVHKSVCFKGWELSGGVGMYFDGDYQLVDRHFVVNALMPSIENFYKADSIQAWGFIKSHCIIKEKDVSKDKPDFLNRSVYKIVLERYASSDIGIAEEAFNILKEFTLSAQGIPQKADLIYQELPKSSCNNLSNEKKWRLVSLKLNDKDSIVTIFIARVVSHLAQQGYTQAKAELLKWIEQPNFYKKGFGFDQNFILISNIESQLNSDLDYTISLFNALIKSEYVNSDSSDFSPYQAAFILRDILGKDYQKGLAILLELESAKALSKNLQILYTVSLFNTRGTNEAEDEKLLFKIYEDVVNPLLIRLADDSSKVIARFSAPEARELFVQFATRLAAKKKIAEALRIIRIFINDPNPDIQSENIMNGREPSTISSVRGWCGWALMHCAVVDGREHLPEVIKLTENLLCDPNYYVIHVACFAYAQIAKNRLSVLPEKKDILFFNDDHEKALKMAKVVEVMAFDLLNRFKDWPELVQKGMATSLLKAFDAVRSLSEKEVLILMEVISGLSIEIIKQFLPLFLYYAEFREGGYAYWKLGLPKLFDNLRDYSSKKPRKKLREIIEKLEKDKSSNCIPFSWAINSMVEADFGKENGKKTEDIAIHYFDLLSNKYNHFIFSNIYDAVIKKFSNFSDYNLEPWFNLLKKCIECEKLKCDQEPKVYLNQIEILILVFEKMGASPFVEAAEIVFTYPKNIMLHNIDKLIPIIVQLGQEGKKEDALKLADLLVDKYPETFQKIKKGLS